MLSALASFTCSHRSLFTFRAQTLPLKLCCSESEVSLSSPCATPTTLPGHHWPLCTKQGLLWQLFLFNFYFLTSPVYSVECRKVPNLLKSLSTNLFFWLGGGEAVGGRRRRRREAAWLCHGLIGQSGCSNMLHWNPFPQAHLSASRLVKKSIVHCNFGKWLHYSDSWTFIYKEHLVFLFQEMLCEALLTRLAVYESKLNILPTVDLILWFQSQKDNIKIFLGFGTKRGCNYTKVHHAC